jgi:catechol 2,3-dioxygenase-like lactoylglutathione lyase family enzyme
MHIVPIVRCRDIEISLAFYTKVLDFEVLNPESEFPYKILMRESQRLDLSSLSGDGVFGSRVLIAVENVDSLYKKFIGRGLDLSGKAGVHRAPVDQTWGMREFYVDDPDGNTVRFAQEITDK